MEFNYLVEKRRMLDSLGRTGGCCNSVECSECLLSKMKNGSRLDYYNFEIEHPIEATEIVRKWANEHPRKTRKEVFLEKFPKARLNENGNPFSCCSMLGIGTDEDCRKNNCIARWNTEVEE